MTTTIYAALSGLWIFYLAINVIKHRRKHKVNLGDGGIEELQTARSAHSNAVEYIPIFLILLFAAELNGANLYLLHGFGVLMVGGRLLHARGLLQPHMNSRVQGMITTFFVILGLALINLIVLPYSQFFA